MTTQKRPASVRALKTLTPFYDAATLKEVARGRWVELFAMAGMPSDILDGRHHPCPRCGGVDRFRLIDEDAGAVRCNHCLTDAGDGIAVIAWWLGCDFREALQWVAEQLGISPTSRDDASVSHPRRAGRRDAGVLSSADDNQGKGGCDASVSQPLSLAVSPSRKTPRQRPAATYVFTDEAGEPLYMESRVYNTTGKKSVKLSRYVNGKWTSKRGCMSGCRLVLYNLPALLRDTHASVLLTEGPNKAQALIDLGLLATSILNGTGGWKSHKQHACSVLTGRDVAIIPDNDDEGRRFADTVAADLSSSGCRVKIVELPRLAAKEDIVEWLEDRGGTKDELLGLIQAAEVFRPLKNNQEKDASPPPYEPFPTERLPEPLSSYVKDAAEAIDCSAAYVSLPLLATLAGAIGNSRSVRLKHGWTEPAVLWCVTVGDSGSRKSPGFDAGTWALATIQTSEFSEWRQEHDDWERRRREAGREFDEAEPEPVRYVVQDATVEGLAVLLEANPRGLLLARDELSGWLSGFDQYRVTAGADVAHWLSIHGARPLIVDRKTGKRITHCPRAAVSICGGIQPGALARAIQGRGDAEHVENGLLARLLLAYPPYTPKRWTEGEVSEASRRAVLDAVESLLRLEPGPDGNPVEIELTPEGLERWKRFVDSHGAEQADLPGPLRAAWSKLEAYAARLALVIHLVRQVAGDAGALVDLESVECGIELARWFGSEAARVYQVLGAAEDSPEAQEERERRRLIEWIERRGGVVTVREAHRGIRRLKSASEAEEALRCLADAGLGRLEVEQPEGGGRPRTVFRSFVDASQGPSTRRLSTKPSETAEISSFVDCRHVDRVLKPSTKLPDPPVRGRPTRW